MLTAPRYNSLILSQNCFQRFCGISVVIITSLGKLNFILFGHVLLIFASRCFCSNAKCWANGVALCRRFYVVDVELVPPNGSLSPANDSSLRAQIFSACDLHDDRREIPLSGIAPAGRPAV